MMKKVLLVCQAGISTTFLMEEIDKNINEKENNLSVKAISVHEIRKELKDNVYDLLLFTPQLRFLYKSYTREYDGQLEIELIDLDDMATLNVKNIINKILDN